MSLISTSHNLPNGHLAELTSSWKSLAQHLSMERVVTHHIVCFKNSESGDMVVTEHTIAYVRNWTQLAFLLGGMFW